MPPADEPGPTAPGTSGDASHDDGAGEPAGPTEPDQTSVLRVA